MANPLDIISQDLENPQDPMSHFEDWWLHHYSDSFEQADAVTQALYPGRVQNSEWSQQMVSTMYQNWYNSAPEQMKRLLEAGVNPFVAASGIAGADTGSVASSPNHVDSKAPELLGSAASALSSLGGSFGSVANGVVSAMKVRHEIGKIDAETANIFESLGFSKLQSKAMQISLKYMDEKEQIGVWQALADFDKTKAEYQNLLVTHKNIVAQYDEIIARKDLLIAEQGEVQARAILDKALADKADAEAAWTNTERQFFLDHGYKLGSPLYEGLRDKMVSEGTFDMETFGNTVAGYQGKVTIAVEGAKASASWDYRPSNVSEAAAYIGHYAGEALRNIILNSQGVTSWNELKTKIYSNAQAKKEFDQAYKDAREDLYENYLAKKRYYRNIKRGGNTQEVANAYNQMINAKNEYDSFTIEKFGNSILSQITQNATAPAQ